MKVLTIASPPTASVLRGFVASGPSFPAFVAASASFVDQYEHRLLGPIPRCPKPLTMLHEPEAPPRKKRSCKHDRLPSSGKSKPQEANPVHSRLCHGSGRAAFTCNSPRKNL